MHSTDLLVEWPKSPSEETPMKISDRRIPEAAVVTIKDGAFAAAPDIASELMAGINAWAMLEAKVEGIFGHLVKGDPAAIAEFKEQLGWDRRSKVLIDKVADTRPELQHHIAALLNHVQSASDVRNEIAHSIWAVDQHGQMLICPSDTFGRISVHAGGEDPDKVMSGFLATLFRDGRIVGEEEAQSARIVIEVAGGLMNSAWVSFFQPERDETGAGFQDLIDQLKAHPDIAERALNRARSRAKMEKLKARAESQTAHLTCGSACKKDPVSGVIGV